MKQKLLNFTRLRSLVLLAVIAFLGAGQAWGESVTLTAGTNGSECTVNNNNGIKIGTSSKGGDMTITVPANTTMLTLHAAAWKGVTGLSLNISGATTNPSSIALTADAGVTSNSPFTLSGNESNYEFEIALSDITTETVLTFETSASKRCVVWGASATVSGSGSQTETCVTPTFSPAAGTYTSAQNVTISSETTGTTIYYTTDGSAPTTSSNVYSSAIPVSATTTIKAIAVKDGNNNSSVASATYTILNLEHAGTEQDPYTVADARAAIDANTGLTNVYATGIVSEIVTAYGTNGYNNITFNIVDNEGDEIFLQAFRCVGDDAADVVVNDVVVVSGTLTKYGSTYEFGQGCQVVSLTHSATPTINATPNTLTGFTYEAGSGPSDEKTFTVSGISLTAGITLSLGENSNFEISTTSGSGFGSSVNLSSDASNVTIYVRLKSGLAEGNYNGTVTLTSTGATDVTVSLSGSVTAPEAAHVTWDLSTDQTATASDTEMTWTSTYASMEAAKGNASTNTNNYYPGTEGKTYTSTRFYSGSNLTITPASGYAITSLVFEATSNGYATALKNSTWTNATASVDGTTVTVTPTNGANAISAAIGGTCGFTEVKVYYVEDNTPSISVDPTSINANCTETEGTITVTYSNIANNSSAAVYFCDSEGASASYDWIDAEINNSKNVYYVISANSSIERTAYMKVKVGEVYSPLITITQAAYVEAAYYLATSITSGKHYVIANGTSGTVKVMSTQNTNNRASVEGTVSGTGLSFETSVTPTEVVIYGPDANGFYTIYDAAYDENAGGYLYAAGGTSNNYLRTEDDLDSDNKGIWSISIDSDNKVATIKSQGTDVTKNWLRNNGSLFSCYASGQSDIYLYEKSGEATPTESKTLNGSGYATYCSQNALDFSAATGGTAWAITGVSGETITFSQIEGSVPAGTGMLLKGAANGSVTIQSAKGATALTTNYLIGTTAAFEVENDGDYYGLSGNQFVKVNAGTVPVGKALLPKSVVDGSGAKVFTFVFEGADGIKTVEHVSAEQAAEIFNLAGQRLQKAQRGVNIINGKKVLVK